MSLVLDVPAGDRDGLERWLRQQEPKYNDRAWFAEVRQAIEAGNWDRAFAYARVVEYNHEYVDARTPEEMAAALGQRARETSVNADPIAQALGTDSVEQRRLAKRSAFRKARAEAAFLRGWREMIGETLDVDLSDLESPEGVRAFAASLERRELKRITALLKESDIWSQTREHAPEPFPPEEPVLPYLAKVYPALAEHGRSREKAAKLHDIGIHSPEALRLHNELSELRMERPEYEALIRNFASAVRREVVASRGSEACPVCDQHVVNPNLKSPIRWLARGIVNIGRTTMFLIEFAFAAAAAFVVYRVVLELGRLIGLDPSEWWPYA